METRSRNAAAKRAKDAQLLRADYFGRLRRDRRALIAFRKIRSRGATDEQIRTLRDEIEAIPASYFCDMWETRPVQQNRRKRLADLLSKTADELEQDVEAAGITLRILGRELEDSDAAGKSKTTKDSSVTTSQSHSAEASANDNEETPDWTLATGIRRAAELLLRPKGIDAWTPSRFERRISIATYAFRSTFLLVAKAAPWRTRPMHITAKLVSALLAEEIDANAFQNDPLIEEFCPAKRYRKD